MAARDPDTGQFVETDGEQTLNYNDLHYQYVGFNRTVGTTTTDDSRAFQTTTEPIDERELDHNQLAELVYMRRHMVCNIEVTGNTVDQTETGAIEIATTFEINSGEAEWLNSDQRDGQFVEENNRNIDMEHLHLQVPFNEPSDQGGGGGGSSGIGSDRREVMFAGPQGMFHRGPVLDANDDLDFRFEYDDYNNTYGSQVKIFYVLGWRVHEVENARPEFGIPL